MLLNERYSTPLWKKIIIFLISFILFCLQLFFIIVVFDFSINLSFSYAIPYIYAVIESVALILILYIINKPMSDGYKITWIVLISFLPLPSMLLYYSNSYTRRQSKRRQRKLSKTFHYNEATDSIAMLKLEDKVGAKIASSVQYGNNFPVYAHSKYVYFSDIDMKFNDMIEEIKKAKSFIYIETFIVTPGYLMDTLIQVLRKKGEEGIEIKFLYDDIGSKTTMNGKLIKELSLIPNIKLNNFQPLGWKINLLANYRDHRKITIIDGNIAYCGGDNLADEYINKKERFGYWRDSCGKYIGEAVQTFTLMFCEMWQLACNERIELPDIEYNKFLTKGYILPFSDGPMNNTDPSYDLFQSLINNAKEKLYISTPYFIIDKKMINSISLVAKSGVEVVLLMPGIPDKKATYYMSKTHYKELLYAGVKIYEFTPGFNHAKEIIVDDNYAFVGTVNMDYRSLFLHYECGALIINDDEILKMAEDFKSSCEFSKLLTLEEWKKRPLYQKLIGFLLTLFAPLF